MNDIQPEVTTTIYCPECGAVLSITLTDDAMRARAEAAEAEAAALREAAEGLRTESMKLGNAVEWDGLPVSWVLALQHLKDVLTSDPCDHVAGYRAE